MSAKPPGETLGLLSTVTLWLVEGKRRRHNKDHDCKQMQSEQESALKILRRIFSRQPHGVGPAPLALDLMTAALTSILGVLVTLGGAAAIFGMGRPVFFAIGAAFLFIGLQLAFFTFVTERLYAFVGPVLHDQLFSARQSLKLANKRLAEAGLHENSEPALLLKEAQELYSQIVISAKPLHRKFSSWSPHYTMESLEFAVTTQKLPVELLEQLKALVEAALPLEVFFDVFDASLARSLPSGFKAPEQATLSHAANVLQASLGAASERILFDAGARVEIEKMFDGDVALKPSSTKPDSGTLT